MREIANITPEVLKWARETAKLNESQAANKVSVNKEKIREWESGTTKPTIRQAEILARTYQRPFAVLFLPEIPNDFQPLQDFRKTGSDELSTAAVFIIRKIQLKQNWIREDNRENGIPGLPFVGKYSTSDDPALIAQDILDTLGIDPLAYGQQEPLKHWIEKSERQRIFISRASSFHSHLKINKNELQGFAIADPFAPFVFINSDDWEAPQLFTLVHELAHIWIASTGISNIPPDVLDKHQDHSDINQYYPVELFCNEIAASALMPKTYIQTLSKSDFNNSKSVFKIAKALGVSAFALLVRAKNLNVLSQDKYNELKQQVDHDFFEFLRKEERKKLKQKEQGGGPNFYLLRLHRNGRLFTQSVLDAYNSERIEPTVASLLLEVKWNGLSKIEQIMYQ